MRLQIVSPYDSQAMKRLTAPLHELSRLYDVTETQAPEAGADIYIHAPYHTMTDMPGLHIAMYTHANPGDASGLLEVCNRADMVTAMSFTGRKELLDYGVDPRKIWVVPCAADDFAYRRRVVLVVGNVQPNGRKRESLLLDLAWQYDLSAYEFMMIGWNWGEVTDKLKKLGVNAATVDNISDNALREAYRMADVLLVTGYAEGGSLPILEAMASGTPVLSPRFGYAADYLDFDNLYTDTRDLYEKLTALNAGAIKNHRIARAWTWRDYVNEYALIIGRLAGQSVDLYPEYGVSRYAQLLDLIDEHRPRKIAEIGTWNGNRAIQMLQQAGKYYPADLLRYQGFDLFEQQTGEQYNRELSKHGYPLDVVRKRIEATGANTSLIAGDTHYTIGQLAPADLYFIDGGHSEYTVENDGGEVMRYLNFGGIAVFDDYYHSGKPDGMGCNDFIDHLPAAYVVKHLPARTYTADGREIGMVTVCQPTFIKTITDIKKKL
jgi:predicted O-methyltransferase YrrM